MSAELFIICTFGALAVWIAVGIFSPRLASLSRRGIKDLAACSVCGSALGDAPVVIDTQGPNNDPDAS
jgi:hypothetical protein